MEDNVMKTFQLLKQICGKFHGDVKNKLKKVFSILILAFWRKIIFRSRSKLNISSTLQVYNRNRTRNKDIQKYE